MTKGTRGEQISRGFGTGRPSRSQGRDVVEIPSVENRRSSWRTSVLVVLAFSFTFVLSAYTIAVAGTACSSFGYYSNNGVSYKALSCINAEHSLDHQAYAVTLVYVTSGSALSGWVGAQPRRYNDTGTTLQCTGTWTYNSSPMTSASGPLNPAGCFINNHSAYSAKGQTRAWNGSSYSTYVTFTSPAQNS